MTAQKWAEKQRAWHRERDQRDAEMAEGTEVQESGVTFKIDVMFPQSLLVVIGTASGVLNEPAACKLRDKLLEWFPREDACCGS